MTIPTTDPVPSAAPLDLLFNAEKLDQAVNSALAKYVDRFGVERLTLAGAAALFSHANNRGVWQPATAYQVNDLVSVSGAWWVCFSAHTSSSTFAADQSARWRVFQGASGDALADAVNVLLGDYLLGVRKKWTGAVGRTQDAVNEERASIYDALPPGFDLATDATVYVQRVLNSGSKVVDFLGVALKCDDVTAPAGVELRGVNWTRFSSNAGDGLKLNSGCRVTGRLAGTGSTGIAQYLLSPAAAGVADVTLDVDLSNSTFGALINANATRWKGRMHVHDLVRSPTAPVSFEGSALNLQGLTFSDLTVTCAGQIPGAGLFVQGGVRDNHITIRGDVFGFFGIYGTSIGSDAAIARNTFTVDVQAILNLNSTAAERSGVKLVGKCYNNEVHPLIVGTTDTTYGVFITASGTDFPINNRIINGSFEGFFAGENMIRMFNASGTFISQNALKGRAGAAAIGMYGSGNNPSAHGGFIENNDIDMQGNAVRGVYVDITSVPSYIGPNNIRATGTALRVDDQSGGKRQGFSRKVSFSGSTAVVGNGASTTVVVTLPDAIQTSGRIEAVRVTPAAGTLFATGGNTPPSQTQISFFIANTTTPQAFTYTGTVKGD